MSNLQLEYLANLIARQLKSEQNEWFNKQIEKLSIAPNDRELKIALGMVPRKLGRDDLQINAEDRAAVSASRADWDIDTLSIDVAARIVFLATAASRFNAFSEHFSSLCRYGDVAEQVACYRALPFLPEPQAIEEQVGEGLRSNIKVIFEAIAHHNPYPAEIFDEHRWNHMVLKALFVESKLDPIYGLDRRANAELAQILCDYAHERWAAGRPVTPELWRCVGPFADERMLCDLERAAATDEISRKAAALAFAANQSQSSNLKLEKMPELAEEIVSGRLTWSKLAKNL